MLAVALTGGVLAAVGEMSSHASQREREAELLFIGNEFRRAIGAYYELAPGGAKRYPQKLEDLLEDKRHPAVTRYLRRIYVDPMTAKAEWGVVEAPEGGIMGVFSLSGAAPVKTGGFDKADEAFAGAASYAEWKFTHSPVGLSPSQSRNTQK